MTGEDKLNHTSKLSWSLETVQYTHLQNMIPGLHASITTRIDSIIVTTSSNIFSFCAGILSKPVTVTFDFARLSLPESSFERYRKLKVEARLQSCSKTNLNRSMNRNNILDIELGFLRTSYHCFYIQKSIH